MISSSTTVAATSVPPIRLHATDPNGKARELHVRLTHQAGISDNRAAQWLSDIDTLLRREEGRS